MNIAHHTVASQRGYFALSIAVLVSVVASAIMLSLRSKLARMDAESVLVNDREDYAVARQLENLIHDSVQFTAGQRSLVIFEATDMETEITARLDTLTVPATSGIAVADGDDPYPAPPALAFYPASTADFTRVPLAGPLDASDIPYGNLGSFLRFGYYTPSILSQSYTFEHSRESEVTAMIDVTASYYAVPLISQRLVLFNYPTDYGGTRPVAAPDLNYLDTDDVVSGLLTTQFTQDGEIMDAVGASGSDQSMTYYRHRSQLCEETFQYLFGGAYLTVLRDYAETSVIDVSDVSAALDAHAGLYTDDDPPGNAFKMDVGQFDDDEVVYLHQPAASPVEVTLLDTDSGVSTPLVVVFDGDADGGDFKIRFEEAIERPLYFVLRDTLIEFTNTVSAISGVTSGSITGAFLMDENSGFSADASSSQSSRIVYGAVLGHHSLLSSGFLGASNHPVPVMEYPDPDYYEDLETRSPRALMVSTRSELTPVKSENAFVLVP